MDTRRGFLGTVSGSLAATPLLADETPRQPRQGAPARKKLAVITTVWRYRSHSWHMAERFLVGYPLRGKWHQPPFEVVSAYVDQTPRDDLSRSRAKEFGFTIHKTIADALRCGGKRLAVDAVLIIGEHGDYPVNKIGQKQYPRYQFFRQVADVFRTDGRTTPVFNDKHLSWNFSWAREMVETAEKMGFAFLAGSSLPVTWRMPDIDMPFGAEVEEILGVAMGATDIYDFHALEMIQCMAERRKGGERGVVAMQALRGQAAWKALNAGRWDKGGWDPRLFEACLSRSQTLAQPETFSHRYPTTEQIRRFVKDPIAYRFEYAGGLKATMLLMNGLVDDFTLAARLKGQPEPLSTLFYLPPNPNVVYSAALMSNAERMFVTGRAPYPVRRTLLTSGLVEAGLGSLATGQTRLATPHLAVRYQAGPESTYWRL
jgi:hypothetical protein